MVFNMKCVMLNQSLSAQRSKVFSFWIGNGEWKFHSIFLEKSATLCWIDCIVASSTIRPGRGFYYFQVVLFPPSLWKTIQSNQNETGWKANVTGVRTSRMSQLCGPPAPSRRAIRHSFDDNIVLLFGKYEVQRRWFISGWLGWWLGSA